MGQRCRSQEGPGAYLNHTPQVGQTQYPPDPMALASAVVRLLRDPAARAQFGEAGRRRVRKDFTPEAHATNTEAVFHRVLNRRMLSGRKAA